MFEGEIKTLFPNFLCVYLQSFSPRKKWLPFNAQLALTDDPSRPISAVKISCPPGKREAAAKTSISANKPLFGPTESPLHAPLGDGRPPAKLLSQLQLAVVGQFEMTQKCSDSLGVRDGHLQDQVFG